MNNWRYVTRDDLYVVSGLLMLMGIIEKPTKKSYFSNDPFLYCYVVGGVAGVRSHCL
jgi:hypothetical protein